MPEKFLEFLKEIWIVLVLLLGFFGLIILFVVWSGTGTVLARTAYYLLLTAPIWLTFMLGMLFWRLWLLYIRSLSVASQKSVLLEIKLPREVSRSPLAMELFFTSLYLPGNTSFLEQYWLGKIRPWFSCELVSLGGDVKFFIWVSQDKMRDVVEAQLYAQYPDIEIRQVEDYTEEVHWDPETWIMWGTHFKLAEDDVYPIKTYIDYGLDKPAEEEEKIDPISSVLEYLGSVGPNERVWIQILCQAHRKEGLKDGRLFEKPNWTQAALDEIEEIRKEAIVEADIITQEGNKGKTSFSHPTKGQQLKMEAIERSIAKLPFEVMMRGFYIARKDHFNSGNITGLIGSVRQYNSEELNKLKLGWFTDHRDLGKDLLTVFGWLPWFSNHMRKVRNKMEIQMLDAYKKRSIFQPPYQNFMNKPYILTTEELATIFHLPGRVVATPSLKRVESKRAEPPTNLPI